MAVKICGNCGESNAEGSLLCVVCGSSLKDVQMEGTPNADKEYSANAKPAICQHCNELLEQGSLTCKYCGTVVSKTTNSSRYYSHSTSSEEHSGSSPMETFGRGCLWLILGSLALLLIAFVTRSSITISWSLFIPIVILVFWLASKKGK
ncbi:zinc ribbon domain-containing protein [Paenibacillus sp. HB172176]|uniref:double zinc ribbon domain-containing protein n=1 Tax=Paenibacillus sp. HB172176 TaxID=2493690 RepID=UPI001439437B